MNRMKKAIIIGGGIAGSAVALFLKRADIESEIYEARQESESQAGWFLNLAGNGLEVLQTLGLAKALSAEGSTVTRMIMWNAKGRHLGEVRNGAREGLTKSIVIWRSALQRILHNADRDEGIPIQFGKRLHMIKQNAQGVMAVFHDGTTARGDLLIGADGVHSLTRQLINPSSPHPSYTGLVSTGGFTDRLSLSPTTDVQHFVFGRRAFFGYHVRASGDVYWFNNHKMDGTPRRSELREITSAEWKSRLLDMHRDDMQLIQDIITSTEAGIGAFPIYDIATQPVWHQGLVVLIGDAIHAVSPSSGQGASLALEDAIVLARSLRDNTTVSNAFAVYESLRRNRVEQMVAWAHSLGAAKLVTNPIGVYFRDLLMPFFLKHTANPQSLDWIYAYKVDWDEIVAAASR